MAYIFRELGDIAAATILRQRQRSKY